MQDTTKAITVNDSDFDAQVLEAGTPVLVDFWAEWCGPCKLVGPTVEELAGDYAGRVKVAKVNVDESPQVAMRFGIRSIPTLMLFKDGNAAETTIGAQPKGQLAALLDRHLS